jgi:ArsR family transcriptional regulator, arsenate/arsenite/antimonite-responsive transcriptional repressor
MIAAAAFAALAHPNRIEILRLLVRAGDRGMPAGEIGVKLLARQNTMSANLAVLRRTGLVRTERQGRSIRYFADFTGIGELLGFLMEDCCGGRPELCQKIVDDIACR